MMRGLLILAFSGPIFGLQPAMANVQVPGVIKEQVAAIQDRFQVVLEEECAPPTCTPVGCEVSRFLTLDERQTSSLPGLDDEPPPTAKPDYKLAAVKCGFTHESSLGGEQLAALRQRLRQRVSPAGVSLLVSARELPPKPGDREAELAAENARTMSPLDQHGGFWGALGAEMLPFIPWLLTILVGGLISLMLIWGIRRLGRSDRGSGNDDDGSNGGEESKETKPALAGPSTYMILAKADQLTRILQGDNRLAEQAIKPLFDDGDVDELCRVVKHFGSSLLQPFREQPQYERPLHALSEMYKNHPVDTQPDELWEFLGRMERRMEAAKIRLDNVPLTEEFSFLATIQLDELVGLLEGISEEEAVITIAHCPRNLREAFFAASSPAQVAVFIEKLTSAEKMPDSVARAAARKLRERYEKNYASFRRVNLQQAPLLESAINALKPVERKQLVSGMIKDRPDLLSSVAKGIFLDGSLPRIPSDVLTEAFLSVSPKGAASYLATIDEEADVLERINQKLAGAIKDRRRDLSDSDAWLAEETRNKIASFMKAKDAEGVIDLAAINEELLS